MAFIVAIDGPAGSGKGTITKIVGKKMNLINIDTGAMYRCVTLECLNNNIKSDEIEKISSILENIDIQLKKENGKELVFLNKKDVTEEIRSDDTYTTRNGKNTKYNYGRKRYRNNSISKCRCKNIFRL